MSFFSRVFPHFETRPLGAAIEPGKPPGVSRDEFVSSFTSLTREVVKPIFEELAHVANSGGYAATVKEGVDEKDNPYLAITFIPEVGAQLAAGSLNACIFQLKALLSEQAVEYTACYDQRPGKKGVRVTKSDLQSINKVFLEAEIEEFVTSSLEAREPH